MIASFFQVAVAAALVLALPVLDACAADHLEITFGNGYVEGEVAGQRGGLTGGEWQVSGPEYSVEKSPQGRLSLRISRHGTSQAHVPLATPLDSENPAIFIAFDACRLTSQSRAYWTPLAASGSSPMGVGVTVKKDGKVELINHWNYSSRPTDFIMLPEKWHRFELEVNGAEKTFSAFVQVEGRTERVLLAKDVPWETKNKVIRFFRLAQPDGGPESMMLTDNLIIRSDVGFPCTSPLTP